MEEASMLGDPHITKPFNHLLSRTEYTLFQLHPKKHNGIYSTVPSGEFPNCSLRQDQVANLST